MPGCIRSRRRWLAVGLVAVALAASGAASATGGSRYAVVDLGTLGGDSSTALAVNGGVVVGTSRIAGDAHQHAFVYENGAMRDLGVPAGFTDSAATAIDAAGHVAGHAWTVDDAGALATSRAFRSSGGGLAAVAGPSAARPLLTVAGFDASGAVVGTAAGASDGSAPQVTVSGTDGVSTPVAGRATAGGVNAAGDIAGTLVDPAGVSQAFLLRDGELSPLGALGAGGWSVGAAVNAAGDVAGWSTSGPGGVARAVLFRGGTALDLGLPAGTESEARAVNDAGQVVGDYYDVAAGGRRAFLWENGAATDLDALIPAGSGWTLEQATGIDAAGEIVGVGTHDGVRRAFLLVAPGSAPAPAVPAAAPAAQPALASAVEPQHLFAPLARLLAASDPAVEIVNENPSVYARAVDSHGNVYGTAVAGSPTQLLRSSDEGQTWSAVYDFPASAALWDITALSSGTLLASLDTGAFTIWRSDDQGASWTQVLSLPTAPVFYRTLTPHSIAEGDGYVWLGTYNNGNIATTNYLFRSADDGRTWQVASTSSTHRHIHGVRFDDANGRLYVLFGDSTGDGIWQSTDDGASLSALCTSYDCVTIDMAFDPGGSYAVFGQDHYNSTRSIERIDLASGALTTLGALPYSAWSALRVDGTYLIGTTRESGESTPDPNLHLFASADGQSVADVFQRAIPFPTGDANLRVQFAFPNGDFLIQVPGYGTIVARLADAGTVSAPANTTPPSIAGAARVGSTLTASAGTWTGSPTSYAYRWQRCGFDGSGCADVAGATGTTYVPVAADAGHTLRVVVTATNSAGSTPASSATTAVVDGSTVNPLLVVVAHPDDETLGYAGVIESAVAQGRAVYVAVVTNGDFGRSGSDSGWCGAAAGDGATSAHYGVTRDRESVAATSLLGLTWTSNLATTQVFFLGYPDAGLQAIAGSSSAYTGDASGLHHTYADDGDGSNATCNGDLHYLATGTHAQLTAANLAGDLDRLLALTHPVDVYTHATFDGHPDHVTVSAQVVAAIARSGSSPTVHVTLMHPEGSGNCQGQSAYLWPNPADPTALYPFSRFTPGSDIEAPPVPVCSSSPTGTSWGGAARRTSSSPCPPTCARPTRRPTASTRRSRCTPRRSRAPRPSTAPIPPAAATRTPSPRRTSSSGRPPPGRQPRR